MSDLILPSDCGDVPVFTAEPEGDGPWPGVVVLHDGAGMGSDVQGHARWLAGQGYLAAAPDLYRGDPRRVRCMVRVMRDLMRGHEAPSMTAIEAARSWLKAHPRCTGKVGLIGFCMGGGFAFMLAPRGLYDAVAPSYGGLDDATLARLGDACPIVASYGRKDRSLRGEAARLEGLLTELGVPHDVKEYPNAGHGFMNDHAKGEVPLTMRFLGALVHTRYCPDETADARQRILAFFAQHLGLATDGELSALSGVALARAAIDVPLRFKRVARALDAREPDPEAAAVLVEAYRDGRAPPWLVAHLLGCTRAPLGYPVAREILLSAPGQLAESYAGPAMARIAGEAARDDLLGIMLSEGRRRVCEGAAYGLAKLGERSVVDALVEAVRARRIGAGCAGSLIAQRLGADTIREWLEGDDPVREDVALEGAFSLSASVPGITDPALARAIRSSLDARRVQLAPRLRAMLEARIAPLLGLDG